MYTFNRPFKVWCACYFYELLQRVHYASFIGRVRLLDPLNVSEALVETLKNRIMVLCSEMGQLGLLQALSTEQRGML